MLIYLAGTISYYHEIGRPELAENWRRSATSALNDIGHTTFDPTVNFKQNIIYYASEIVAQNEYYLKQADLILVNLADLDKSYGTIFELVTAHNLNKPVVAFNYNKASDHPHINATITSYNADLQNAIHYISSLYYL